MYQGKYRSHAPSWTFAPKFPSMQSTGQLSVLIVILLITLSLWSLEVLNYPNHFNDVFLELLYWYVVLPGGHLSHKKIYALWQIFSDFLMTSCSLYQLPKIAKYDTIQNNLIISYKRLF